MKGVVPYVDILIGLIQDVNYVDMSIVLMLLVLMLLHIYIHK